jgi:glycosyltransferase involved in cell wall biosynthesis
VANSNHIRLINGMTHNLPVEYWEQGIDSRHAKSSLAWPAFQDANEKIDVSVVIPVLNEEKNIVLLHSMLVQALDTLDKSSEIIYVDDGSTDLTYSILTTLSEDERVKVIRLRRNFGQTAAFSAGFDLARGEIIITMDGDLQNDAADIPRLLEKMEEGFDIVSGWRIHRKDQFLTRRFPSQIANALISLVTGVKLHDYGCSLKAYRSDVVKNVNLYGDMHRFIPALASWMGIQVAEIPVNHSPRKYGKSKYGLGRTIKVILDLLTVKFLLDYATRPIQIFGLMGLFSFMTGSAIGIYLTFVRLFMSQAIGDRPLLLLSVMLILLGVNLIIMGLLGELTVRTYHEAQGKPIYLIREILGTRTRKETIEQE